MATKEEIEAARLERRRRRARRAELAEAKARMKDQGAFGDHLPGWAVKRRIDAAVLEGDYTTAALLAEVLSARRYQRRIGRLHSEPTVRAVLAAEREKRSAVVFRAAERRREIEAGRAIKDQRERVRQCKSGGN